jgi:hypothetical protein
MKTPHSSARARRSFDAIPWFGLLGLGVIGACSASKQVEIGAGSTTGSGQGGTSDASSSVGLGVGGSFTGTGGGMPQGSCSADLQSIVDADGNVIAQCPSNQGCFGGQCVPACEAAAKSKGSIGCDFYAADPPFYLNAMSTSYDGSCYAAFVANTWSRPAKLTVTRAGKSFDMTKFAYIPSGILPNINYSPVPATGVPAGSVAILFLAHKPAAKHELGTPLTCPVTPALVEDAAISGSGAGAAFHVVSDTPVTAYDIKPYGGAKSYLPSATLLFPSTAWGTNYYAVAPHSDGGGELWMLLVGSAEGTKVTMAPKGQLPTTITLNAGQTMQWTGQDPTGTVLQSTAPVGVFTGSTYLRVATQTSPSAGGQDSQHTMVPPINALGSEYVAPGIMSRLSSKGPESVPYRVLGIVDGTSLTYDPPRPTAPKSLKAGEVAEFESTSAFVVTSQDEKHPFLITLYMPGTPGVSGKSTDGCGPVPPFPGLTQCALGDEDWGIVLSPKQFLQRYVFFTDPTYATTNLVVTRVKGAKGFEDVTIGCLSSPITGWTKVGAAGKYEVAHVDLVRGAAPIANCKGSQHEAKSKGQFGVTVWGTDWYSSYNYPAGGNIGSINAVVVPPNPN